MKTLEDFILVIIYSAAAMAGIIFYDLVLSFSHRGTILWVTDVIIAIIIGILYHWWLKKKKTNKS